MDIVIGHQNLDFDCVSSMVAAKKLHPGANIFLQPTAEGNVLEYLNLYEHHFSFYRQPQFEPDEVETVVVVDTNRRSRLGPYEEALDTAERVVLYDHHPPENSDIDADEYVYDSVGALITYLVEQLREDAIKISPIEATLFLLGLHQETGSLLFGTTQSRDYEIGRYLMESGADLDVVQNFIHRQLSDEQMDLFNDLLENSRNLSINNVPVTITTAVRDDYVPEISLLAHKFQDTENSNFLCVLVQLGEHIQLVLRNRHESVDAGGIAEEFGGGGHARAASATLSGVTLKEAQNALEDTLRHRLKPGLIARDLMSDPVHSIRQDLPVEEAHKVMLRLGHQGMPITNDAGELVGIISRADIDKAVRHELEHAPVKGFMSPQVVTVEPDTSLSQLRNVMMSEQIGRLPVVEDGELIGIVTRSDIIQALHEQKPVEEEMFRSKDPSLPGAVADNIEPRLNRTMGETWAKRFRQWGKIAEEMGESLFLVGGCVRDILMEESTKDIDFVVEEDGIKFGQALREETGGTISTHEKFKTAEVTLPDGDRVDIATARSEYYSHPAALPDVEIEHTSVVQDLRRRDFTINAMAVSLNPGEYGDLLDLYGGRDDLENGLVRILYATSFLDDPTRMFRAIRFSRRFGFVVEERTEFQLKQALQGNPFDPVSGDRLREEFNLIFNENNPLEVIDGLFEQRILQHLSPEFSRPEPMDEWFETAETLINQFEPEQPNLVYFCLLFEPLTPGTAAFMGRRLNLPRAWRRTIEASQSFEEVRSELSGLDNPSDIHEVLDQFDDQSELLLARMAVDGGATAETIRRYLEDITRKEPLVTGEVLKEWGMEPGPQMGDVLEELFYYQLDHDNVDRAELKQYFEERYSVEQ